MRKLLFFLLIFMAVISCKKDENTAPYPAPTNPNLKYFGYTLVDVGFDDPTDKETKTNYTDEVAHFTNMADILVIEPDQDLSDRINLMYTNNVKVIFHLNELFFEQTGTGGDKSGVFYSLRADYENRWTTFITTNDILLNEHKIQSFYLGEEPVWNGISYDDLKLASDLIKLTIPSVPILVVEAYLAIDDMQIPESVDWIGFDRYFLVDPSSDATYLDELERVKLKRSNNQDIILVLDGHFLKKHHGSVGIGKSDLDVVARNYYNLANTDTSIVGIIGYYWPSGFEFKSALGTRGLPQEVINEHIRIGKAITGK